MDGKWKRRVGTARIMIAFEWLIEIEGSSHWPAVLQSEISYDLRIRLIWVIKCYWNWYELFCYLCRVWTRGRVLRRRSAPGRWWCPKPLQTMEAQQKTFHAKNINGWLKFYPLFKKLNFVIIPCHGAAGSEFRDEGGQRTASTAAATMFRS